MMYTVELSLEIEAPSADDAASLALLEVQTATEPLTVEVYSEVGEQGDEDTARHWRRITVEPEFTLADAGASRA